MSVLGTPIGEDLPGSTYTPEPTVLDTKVLPKVYAVIQKYGTKAIIVVVDRDVYNAAAGTRPRSSEVEYGTLTNGRPLKVSPPAEYDEKYIDGTTVRKGDAYVIVPAQYLPAEVVTALKEKSLDTRVKHQLLTWQVTHVMPYFSGDLIAAWQLHLRH